MGEPASPVRPPPGTVVETWPGALTGAAGRELWAWCFLAVVALAVAGVFAVLLAISRLPGIEDVFPWPLAFFEKGLVIHVVYSFVVWFLAVFGALLHLATHRVAEGKPRANALGMTGVALVAGASIALFIPALLDRGEPTLNNYVPVIVDPLYYAGLIALAGGVALAAVRLAVNLPGRRTSVEPAAFAFAAGGALDYQTVGEGEFGFDAQRCSYAEHLDKLGARDLGALLACRADGPMAEGMGVAFERRQTLMSGGPCCDFRYRLGTN